MRNFRIIWSIGVLAAIAATLVGGCVSAPQEWPNPGNHWGEIEVDGRTRDFLLHVPESYGNTGPMPLMIVLHGGGGGSRGIARYTHISDIADREGFLVVYPKGVEGHWNCGRAIEEYTAMRENVDDVRFIRELIDAIASALKVDRDRVYICGASNGGMMAFRLAIEAPELFAAVAPVIASIPLNIHQPDISGVPLPIMIVAGTEDGLVPWQGGHVRFRDRILGEVVSVPESVRYWVGRNGCDSMPFIHYEDKNAEDGTRVRFERYGGGEAEVVLVAVEGGGHTWPGADARLYQFLFSGIVGRESKDIDASEVISQFCLSKARKTGPERQKPQTAEGDR